MQCSVLIRSTVFWQHIISTSEPIMTLTKFWSTSEDLYSLSLTGTPLNHLKTTSSTPNYPSKPKSSFQPMINPWEDTRGSSIKFMTWNGWATISASFTCTYRRDQPSCSSWQNDENKFNYIWSSASQKGPSNRPVIPHHATITKPWVLTAKSRLVACSDRL